MKKMLVLLFAIGLIPAAASAQINYGADGVGVFFDPDAASNCAAPVTPGTLLHAYVCITNVSTYGGVRGYEFRLDVDPVTTPIANKVLPPNALDVLSSEPMQWAVGMPFLDRLPQAASLVILEFDVLVGTDPIDLYVDQITAAPPSIPGWPAFVDGIDPGHVLPLQQVSGGPGLPVASINGDCPVDDEDATWGGVKALYR